MSKLPNTGKQQLMLLPVPSTTLCFDKNVFMKDDFSVDQFVGDCRRRVQLETLRQDLEIYFKLLKNAMIELINKDYADFVNLSSNLVGMEKAIDQLSEPLQKIKHDVSEVQEVICQEMTEFEVALEKQKRLMEERDLLGHMQGLLQCVEKIEHIQRSDDSSMGQTLERIAGEFNQLQHHTTYCRALPVLTQIRPRISDITSYLQSNLEGELVKGIGIGEATRIHRCLNSYALIGKTRDAENLVRAHVVKPYLDEVLHEQNGNVVVSSLKPMFSKILNLVPTNLRLLCDITSGRKNKLGEQFRGIPGYDFVVNSAWPEIVRSLGEGLPDLFSSGDPNKFHQRYVLCMNFVDNFERHCGSQENILHLRQSEPFQRLMTHWSLPVYFQIRFQDIGRKLESSFELTAEANPSLNTFRLTSSSVLWECIQSCWKEDIFLPALIHRFWKLTLQLLSRYKTWISTHNNEQSVRKTDGTVRQERKEALSLNHYAGVILDVDQVCDKMQQFYLDTIEPKAKMQSLKDTAILSDALKELLDQLKQYKQGFVDHIVTSLCTQSMPLLKQAQDVPRLFRKTNRPAPTDPSPYVVALIKPIKSFHDEQCKDVEEELLSDWLTKVVASVSEKFYSVVSDVLTSVRKMEESLMRLQKMRGAKSSSGNLAAMAGGGAALSDDDKIRLQLYIDVSKFGEQMDSCGVKLTEVEKYQLLLSMVTEAKNKKSDAM